jgi:hypothetical protein
MIEKGYPPFSLCAEVYLLETPKCAFYSTNKVNMTKNMKFSSS